jgi:hypothetical protein
MILPETVLEKYIEHIMTDDGYRGWEKLIRPKNAIKAMEEFHKERNKDELTAFLQFLMDNSYCNSGVYCELPTAIDRYLHPEL